MVIPDVVEVLTDDFFLRRCAADWHGGTLEVHQSENCNNPSFRKNVFACFARPKAKKKKAVERILSTAVLETEFSVRPGKHLLGEVGIYTFQSRLLS